MDSLSGKVAVVTGAASGIGLALVRRFVSNGMKVACADVDGRALTLAVTSLGSDVDDVVGIVTDVADPDAVDALRDEVFARFGTAHVVCNNAGIGGSGRLTDAVDLDKWRRVLDVDLFGVVHGIRSFLPRLLEQGEGHIVNTSSRQGLLGTAGVGAYCAAKFGVVGLTEVLDAELRDMGSDVHASVLCPGPVRTGMTSQSLDRAGIDQRLAEEIARRLESAIEPEQVAQLVIDAIRERRLYVNTHAETIAWLVDRHRRIVVRWR